MFSIPSDDAVKIAQTYGLWIQTGAICLSAIAAVILIIWTKRVACRRASLDVIMSDETQPAQIELRRMFLTLRKKDNLVQWLADDKADSEETATIRAILNQYELVAIGIFEGTLDEKIYRRWCRSTLVNDWIACKSFVTELRRKHGSMYFCEYEKLARKWAVASEINRV